MSALDTELQMPLMEQCDDQVNAKELVKKIKNLFEDEGAPSLMVH